MTSSSFRSAHNQGRNEMRAGNTDRAVATLLTAAAKTTADEQHYRALAKDLRDAFIQAQQPRAALTIDWYLGASGEDLIGPATNLLPELDRARTLQWWGARTGDGAGHYRAAAHLYEQCGQIAQAAICHERAGDHGSARGLWSRLSQSLPPGTGDAYASGLARFNLARTCTQLGDDTAAASAMVASVHRLEEAADHFEQVGQRERTFDCYQVLIAVGKASGQFEHVLEGYVNAVRILREDNLRYYALQHYEEVLELAQNADELTAAATLAKEMASYADAEGMPAIAMHAAQQQAVLWQGVAQSTLSRGAPPQMAENALLAAVITLARRRQYADVGKLYETLSALELGPGRRAHYARAAQRYQGVVNEDVNASPLAPHLRQDSAFPDVWHVDLVEWEQRGSASAAAGEVLLELDGSEPMWPDVTRRRAMLARLHALVFERAGAQAANEQTRRLVGLLGVLELYVILSPLEALFRHPEPAVRIAVLQALGRFMYKRSFVTVRTALRDEDGTVQQEARRALESLRFPHAFDPLARIYRESTNEHDRAAALTALGRIDTREAAELLVDVFQFDGPTERAAAATALSRARGRTFFQVAREALPNVSGDARTAISDVFASRGETI